MPARRDKGGWRCATGRVFALQIALGLGGMLAAVASVATAVVSVHRAPAAGHDADILGLRFTYPTLNLAALLLIVLAALGVAVMTIAVRGGWRQRQAYRSFVRRLGSVARLDGTPTVRVIEHSRPEAFCAGFLRPAVYVSRRTLELLSDAELQAVLAHEHHHLRVRDPLRLAVTRVLSQALFFLPLMRTLCDRYGDVAELMADEAAVRASGGEKAPLASALLVFDASGLDHVAGISDERVDSLLGQPARWRLPVRLTASSLIALSSLVVLMWRASEVASAHVTLNLPIVSSQPCLMILMTLPVLGFVAVLARRGRGGSVARPLHVAIPH